MRKAWDYVRENPVHFVKLMGIKAVRLWFPYYSDSPAFLKFVTAFSYLTVVGFGILGIGLSCSRWREFFPFYLLILYVTLIHSITIPGIRYRYPVMPFLMMFAALGMVEFWARTKGQKSREEMAWR